MHNAYGQFQNQNFVYRRLVSVLQSAEQGSSSKKINFTLPLTTSHWLSIKGLLKVRTQLIISVGIMFGSFAEVQLPDNYRMETKLESTFTYLESVL
jgi:hypothetical protein